MFRCIATLGINGLVGDHLKLGISLQSGITFKLQDCYCSFHRIVDAGEVWEKLTISYYSTEKNEKEAKEKIKNCSDLLAFILALPLDYKYYSFDEMDYVPDKTLSNLNKKIMKLQQVDVDIKRFKKSKKMFFDILSLHQKATQYSYMYEFEEEAYLYFFKIIENIAKDYFEKESRNKLKPNSKKVRGIISSIIGKDFNIIYSDNKADEIAGLLSNYLISIASEDIYSKISFLCNHNKIRIDYNMLGKAISLRNKIAHDSYVNINYESKEYGFIMNLSREVIAKKYFGRKYESLWIKPRVSIPGAIFYDNDK